MTNLQIRAIAGAAYVAIIVACIFLGAIPYAVLMCAFSLLGLKELKNMFASKYELSDNTKFFDYAAVCFVYLLVIISFGAGFSKSGTTCTTIAIAALVLYTPIRIIFAVYDKSKDAAASAMISIVGLVYIILPLFALSMFRGVSTGWLMSDLKYILLGMFIFIWLNDTGAYLCGRTWGRTKLCERLSPKKTWEGFAGGLVVTVLGAVIYGLIVDVAPIMYWASFGFLASIMATFGDLFESLLKRTAGVKDSGTLIPGHGGILDRIDSLLLVAYVPFILTVIFIF